MYFPSYITHFRNSLPIYISIYTKPSRPSLPFLHRQVFPLLTSSVQAYLDNNGHPVNQKVCRQVAQAVLHDDYGQAKPSPSLPPSPSLQISPPPPLPHPPPSCLDDSISISACFWRDAKNFRLFESAIFFLLSLCSLTLPHLYKVLTLRLNLILLSYTAVIILFCIIVTLHFRCSFLLFFSFVFLTLLRSRFCFPTLRSHLTRHPFLFVISVFVYLVITISLLTLSAVSSLLSSLHAPSSPHPRLSPFPLSLFLLTNPPLSEDFTYSSVDWHFSLSIPKHLSLDAVLLFCLSLCFIPSVTFHFHKFSPSLLYLHFFLSIALSLA
ncbi:unnamed protein product [Acanthosepion pharaonis]|uniref:Uncharacterized protein n=1 Tax=Acanthosepion pharaonis TaxID=158019 RepID=A0A812B8T8_ACAPH|nr:unnamed protein product [Sepia pharaonis]